MVVLFACRGTTAKKTLSDAVIGANLIRIEAERDGQKIGTIDLTYKGLTVATLSLANARGEVLYRAVPEYDTRNQLLRVHIQTGPCEYVGRYEFEDGRLTRGIVVNTIGSIDTMRFEYDDAGHLIAREGNIDGYGEPQYAYRYANGNLAEAMGTMSDSLSVQRIEFAVDSQGKPQTSTLNIGTHTWNFRYLYDRSARINPVTWAMCNGLVALPPEVMLMNLLSQSAAPSARETP